MQSGVCRRSCRIMLENLTCLPDWSHVHTLLRGANQYSLVMAAVSNYKDGTNHTTWKKKTKEEKNWGNLMLKNIPLTLCLCCITCDWREIFRSSSNRQVTITFCKGDKISYHGKLRLPKWYLWLWHKTYSSYTPNLSRIKYRFGILHSIPESAL